MTSRNAGSVRTRTVGSALYNMCVQTSNILSSQVRNPKMENPIIICSLNFHPLLCLAIHLANISRCQVYREEDRPLYRTGNKVLLALTAWTMVLIVGSKFYYKWRNASREKVWSRMSESEKSHYLKTTTDQGNKRYVIFVFCICYCDAKILLKTRLPLHTLR